MNPDRKYLTDEEYAEMIEKIKANLQFPTGITTLVVVPF